MSIFIRGMEMPKVSGRMEAVITILKDGTAQIAISPSDDQIGHWKEYPLVPVQPHGRLIDADKLDDVCVRLNSEDWGITVGEHKLLDNVLFEFPTVLPAEQLEEDSPAGALCKKCLCFTCEWRLSCGKLEGNTSEYCRSRCKGEAGLMTRCSEFKQRLLGEMRSVTNEEKLKNKTTFELAKFLCFLTRCPPWKRKPSCINNCVACWNDWLQSDASEEEET